MITYTATRQAPTTIQWVHGTTTYDRNNTRTFIAANGEGHNLFIGGRLFGTFGTVAGAKAYAETHRGA